MADEVKKIGLSLGADICWPQAYEQIMQRWNPELKVGEGTVSFEVERVRIEPFSLAAPTSYDLVIDRLTHWYTNTREWIKKAVILDGVYVFNNPWSVQSMEKQTSYCAMMRLGLHIPDTWMVPPKDYEQTVDLKPTLEQYADMFDLDTLGDELGYPLFMKPYDGGGWRGVTKVDDADGLQAAYDESGRSIMHLQAAVLPFDHFVRGLGLGPQVRVIEYDPAAPLHERYTADYNHLSAEALDELRTITLTINAFFGWDFNSAESLGRNGVWHPIDFANPCPDSQVTSLNRHWPWLVVAKLRWSLFAAATGRPFRPNLDWGPWFDVADTDRSYEEKLTAYRRLADDHFDTERFNEFVADQLAELDEVAYDYFGSDDCRRAVREKVTALFPDHEVDDFTERFFASVQEGREDLAS